MESLFGIGPAPGLDNYSSLLSNYLIYYLLNYDELHTNCSVYLLISGDIKMQLEHSGKWVNYSNTSDFLPSYYVTNCLIPELHLAIDSITMDDHNIHEWLQEFKLNPYSVADNGDSFVALLFMLSGLCVLCWMLMLLFILLPNHKRKPILTQLATLLYLIVLTILLAKVTEAARSEYYRDLLDMIYTLLVINDKKRYPIVMVILQLLTSLAFVQLVMKMTKNPWKRVNAGVGLFFIIVYIIMCLINLAKSPDFIDSLVLTTSRTRELIVMVSRLAFIAWIGITLAYHTLKGTESSPRQVSYSRRLFPLACFTWSMLVLHFVITILIASLWEHQWLVFAWVTFLPYLLEMYVLTTAWEWFYSIRDLESRLELIGMLGRRISLDDVMSFSNHHRRERDSWPIYNFFMWVWAWITGKPTSLQTTKDVSPDELADARDSGDTGDNGNTGHTGDTGDNGDNGNDAAPQTHNDSDSSDFSYDVRYVDDHEWARHEGPSSQAQEIPQELPPNDDNDANESNDAHDNNEHGLPAFQPLPGFTRDDYWDEKMTH